MSLQQGNRIQPRVTGIDGLRGLAILAVMFFHAPSLKLGVQSFLQAGWLGVDVFFVISGYLITSILLRPDQSLGVFYARRAWRILPLAALYLALLLVLCDQVLLGMYPLPWRSIAPYAFFAGNFGAALNPRHLLAPFALMWSLAIEEQFYVFWPAAARHLSRRTLSYGLLAIVVLSPFARWYALERYGVCSAYYLTPVRLDGLALGALLAMHGSAPVLVRVATVLRWTALVGLLALFTLPFAAGSAPFLNSVAAALTALAIVGFAAQPTRALSGPLAWVGQRCYALYLGHVVIGLEVAHIGLRGAAGVAVFVAASIAAAELVQRFVESPLIRFGRTLETRPVRFALTVTPAPVLRARATRQPT